MMAAMIMVKTIFSSRVFGIVISSFLSVVENVHRTKTKKKPDEGTFV